eukprot:gene391-5008_t
MRFELGSWSGVAGSWSVVNNSHDASITLTASKLGTHGSQSHSTGDLTLATVGAGSGDGGGGHEQSTVTVVLAWHFPHRWHFGEQVGNNYNNHFGSSAAAAAHMAANLPSIVSSIAEWNAAITNNDLSKQLRDFLVNSISTIAKTGIWVASGEWRQFESFSADDIDPVHIHLYRSIPYAWFFPELEQSVLEGYKQSQQGDGYILENSPFGGQEEAGRMMGDTSTAYILAILQLWRSQGAAIKPWIAEMYPSVRAAATWQLNRSSACGLPTKLETSYDWFGFAEADVAAYNAFMHIAGLKAAMVLADVVGDTAFGPSASRGVKRAQDAVASLLWRQGEGEGEGEGDGQDGSDLSPPPSPAYYRATASLALGNSKRRTKPTVDTLLTDTLYGQAWAHHLGLGWLVPPDTVREHLASELVYSGTKDGLLVMFNASHPRSLGHDNMYWEGGSFDWSTLQLYSIRDSKNKNTPNPNSGFKLKSKARAANNGALVLDYTGAMGPGAHAVLNKYHGTLADLWNWRDLSAGPGTPCAVVGAIGGVSSARPWCNGHYGRQLVGFMLPNAVSGLRANGVAVDNNSTTLSLVFDPVPGAPSRVPVVLPGSLGLLIFDGVNADVDDGTVANTPRLEITAGKVCLVSVELVGRAVVDVPPRCLIAGSSVSL